MSRLRLLLVDDEVVILEAFAKYFTALGYEVYKAGSGEEGLALFGQVHPDVTVLDVMMPGISGIEVLRTLREQDAAVVMLTGVDAGETAAEALRLGAVNFLLKPVDLPRLASAVREAAATTQQG